MENLNSALNEAGKNIVEELKSLARKDNFFAIGNLENSFYYEVEGNKVNIYGARYTNALSEGISTNTGGTKADFYNKVDNIELWAKQKGLQPRSKDGRFIKSSDRNLKNMAFNIAKSIGKKGISKRFGYKGSGFFQEMKKNVIGNISDIIAEAYKKDIIIQVEKLNLKYNGN